MPLHLDLVEYDDGIHIRVTPRLPTSTQPHLPGEILACQHHAPLIYDKHRYGYRLASTPICGDSDVTRGAADGDAPRCGCWLPLADGALVPAPGVMVSPG